MNRLLALLILCQSFLFAVDYDCVIVGSSPFSLFEALYQYHSGSRVLILEEASSCGGAWKSIEVCGIPHADLGCHQIGHDAQLKMFLETYAGCRLVSMDKPWKAFEPGDSPNGYYFSQGCFELIDHLTKLISKTNISLLLNHKVESVSIDDSAQMALVSTSHETFTTTKVIVTQMSGFDLNYRGMQIPKQSGKTKYYHLYLLLQDPTPFRFTYQGGGIGAGVSRIMNLTPFVGLENTGSQLLVFQTHSDLALTKGNEFLEALKSRDLLDRSAFILKEDSYIFESVHLNSQARNAAVQPYIEILDTGHIQNLSNYVSKWKQVLKIYSETISN